MNLAMAATLIFYSFHTATLGDKTSVAPQATASVKDPTRGDLCTSEQTESLVRFVLDAVKETQFNKMPDPESTKARLRRVLRSWQLSQGDLLFVFEVFYQLKCWGQGFFEERNFLKK
jgi:tRNA C32,U32 (ribose-2'-O)-methylase TrmJ